MYKHVICGEPMGLEIPWHFFPTNKERYTNKANQHHSIFIGQLHLFYPLEGWLSRYSEKLVILDYTTVYCVKGKCSMNGFT